MWQDKGSEGQLRKSISVDDISRHDVPTGNNVDRRNVSREWLPNHAAPGAV